ncbi:4'-phosphopantetheinyl transferase family protein [Intrasporangium mesophilum]
MSDVVDVWLAPVTSGLLGPSAERILDEDERQQAERFHRDDDRRRYTVAHASLRVILGARLGVAPECLRFGRDPCPVCGGPNGRPTLMDSAASLHFSLSHAGGLVAVAVASAPVGIDVEPVPGVEVVSAVLETLHPRERDAVLAAPLTRRSADFTRMWTRKEALLKGIGTGLAHGLTDHDVTDGAHPRTDQGWSLAELPVGAGYAGAVALRGARVQLRLRSRQLSSASGG